MMNFPQKATIETKTWAYPREGMALTDLVTCMINLGNQVIEVDETNNRLLVAHSLEHV